MRNVMVRLKGGLGNQMFQYAAGKSLAVRLGVPLKLDTSFLEIKNVDQGYTLRNFELDVFNIDATVATKTEVSHCRKPLNYNIISKYFSFFSKTDIFPESQATYQPEFEKLHAPVYLEGYWQTEKYFLSIASRLKEKDFTPLAEISSRNALLLNEINSCNCVSIHVRRGDYVNNPSTNKFHGICSELYYEQAAKIINKKTKIDHFYIFSDEPEWAKENIKLSLPATFVSHNIGRESHWDLFLMRNCKHNIIANSSFSWWGAWLNKNPNKIILTPEKWFNDETANNNEIVPEGWIKYPKNQ
ncbi:alpha-1,2-fucosyltransferase [soil metagenome]